MHFLNNVAAPYQFSLDVELWESWPLAVDLKLFANQRISEDVVGEVVFEAYIGSEGYLDW